MLSKIKFCRCSIVVIFFVMLYTKKAQATNYYLSATGNDNYSGTSTLQPWKTIQYLNKQQLKAGDSVLFKRGNSFYGELVCSYSGNKTKPIVYAAYGAGTMPEITGAVIIKKFSPFKNDIYAANITQNILAVFINNQQQILARYPNTGFNIMQNGVGNTVTFIDSILTQPDGYWNGANIRFRTWDWEVRTSIVNSFANNTVTIKDSSTNNLAKGWGYYFDGKFELLDTTGEWFYDKVEQQLFFYSMVKPTDNITAVTLLNGITIKKNVQYVTISQLQIRQFFDNGIILAGNNRYISISNNNIQQIDKTGIFINEVALHCNVSNNKITKINGRGIFALEPEYLLIKENNVSDIGNTMGYGISGVNNMIGIVVANNEIVKEAGSHIAQYNTIRKNVVDSIGYVGIRMDGANSIMEYNNINNVMGKLSDGAAVYCWSISKNYTHHNQIHHNIVSNVSGSNYGTPSGPNPAANGIYIDNNCYNILVENNIVLNISASGIHINSDSYNNVVKNNTIYNCLSGFSVAEWAKPSATFGNNFTKNNIFLLAPLQRAITLINFLLPGTKGMVSMDSNRYYHFWGDTLMTDIFNIKNTTGNPQRITNEYDFNGLQKIMRYEKSGKSIRKIKGINSIAQSKLLYNNTGSIKTIQLTGKEYYSLQGKKINEVILKPYHSFIIVTPK